MLKKLPDELPVLHELFYIVVWFESARDYCIATCISSI
jgi:hypothetical protein